MLLHRQRRRGVTVVECALVYPVFFLLLFGLIIGGLGIMRYQELASLAREGARWASVHGAAYAAATGNPAATSADVYNTAIVPNAVGFDPSKMTYSVTWNTDNNVSHSVIVNNEVVAVQNLVTVTLTYQWFPEAFFGAISLTSTSVMPMTY